MVINSPPNINHKIVTSRIIRCSAHSRSQKRIGFMASLCLHSALALSPQIEWENIKERGISSGSHAHSVCRYTDTCKGFYDTCMHCFKKKTWYFLHIVHKKMQFGRGCYSRDIRYVLDTLMDDLCPSIFF